MATTTFVQPLSIRNQDCLAAMAPMDVPHSFNHISNAHYEQSNQSKQQLQEQMLREAFFPGGMVPEIDDDFLDDIELPVLKKNDKRYFRGELL